MREGEGGRGREGEARVQTEGVVAALHHSAGEAAAARRRGEAWAAGVGQEGGRWKTHAAGALLFSYTSSSFVGTSLLRDGFEGGA